MWSFGAAAAATIEVTPAPAAIQRALERASAGDVVVLGPGTYNEVIALDADDAGITLRGAPGARVRLTHHETVLTVSDTRDIRLQDLDLGHDQTMRCSPGVNVVDVERSTGVTLTGSRLDGSGDICVSAATSSLVVRDSELTNCVSHAVKMEGGELLFEGNIVHGNHSVGDKTHTLRFVDASAQVTRNVITLNAGRTFDISGGEVAVVDNVVWGNGDRFDAIELLGRANRIDDPRFVDPLAGDFRSVVEHPALTTIVDTGQTAPRFDLRDLGRACNGGTVPLGYVGEALVTLQIRPGGAMEGGFCVQGLGDWVCDSGNTTPDILRAWYRSWPDRLSGRGVEPDPTLACGPPELANQGIRRASLVAGQLALAAWGRALTVQWTDDQAWEADEPTALLFDASGRLALAGAGYGDWTQPFDRATVIAARRAPRICPTDLTPGTQLTTKRTEVVIRARPDLTSPAIAVLPRGKPIVHLAEVSCAQSTATLGGRRHTGGWVHVLTPKHERDGWVFAPALAQTIVAQAPGPLDHQPRCGVVPLGFDEAGQLAYLHRVEEQVCMVRRGVQGDCVGSPGPSWPDGRFEPEGIELDPDLVCDGSWPIDGRSWSFSLGELDAAGTRPLWATTGDHRIRIHAVSGDLDTLEAAVISESRRVWVVVLRGSGDAHRAISVPFSRLVPPG